GDPRVPARRVDAGGDQRCAPRVEQVGTQRRDRAPPADAGRRATVDDVVPEARELGSGPDLVECLLTDPAELTLVGRRGVATREDAAVLVDERDLPRHQALPRDALVPSAEAVVALPRPVRVGNVGTRTLGHGEVE